ncbi:hypothetical protein J31TS4_45630 [Paenibacillus sp. J31TS4]|uniref:hypothetical protein n=1 Tax=Paenibacillus sp. J31TS4 TaxID=2807195 RepID=UPI001B192DE7|nr:hypothetical protein [Paenibacillus sp. J31TS4]GIP41283.1 hypothetical protein J31TS4_45630 [Paenibacillus sp. J31TS4]
MKLPFAFAAELLRVLLLVLLVPSLLWLGEKHLLGEELASGGIVRLAIANYLLLFLLYRGRLQKTGWLPSGRQHGLSPAAGWTVGLAAAGLILSVLF